MNIPAILSRKIFLGIATFVAVGLLGQPAVAQTQGVTKDEILIGSIQDLSGPIAGYGKSARNGLQLAVDEINAKGGIHGRKLRLIVEDSGYDPKKAVLAAQKIVQKDQVFLTVGTIGTPVAMATMDILFERNVPQLFPLTAARQMYEPLHKLKYAASATYYDQARVMIRHALKTKVDRKWCIIYQDDDFGGEVLAGAEAGLKENGKALIEKTSYKRGATEFSSQVARMKSAGCDTVVMGTIIRETVGVLNEAKKIDLNADFLGTSANYTHLIHVLGGPISEKFMSAHTIVHPYEEGASPVVAAWIKRYKEKFKEPPDLFSAYGETLMATVIAVLQNTGPDLTTDNFIKTLDKTTVPPDQFGGDTLTFTPTKHLGSPRSRISQIKNGRWVVISDYIDP